MPPPTQSLVDLFFGEGLRSKITEPRTDVLMIGVIGIRHRFEKLSKSLRSSAVFGRTASRSEEHTSELQSLRHLVCRLLLEKKKPVNKAADSYRRIDSSTYPYAPSCAF